MYVCVYIYLYLPRCTLVTGWIDLSRRSNIGFSFGGRANSEPPPICSCARRGSAWLRYADCWLEKLTDGGGRSSREARRAFPRSLLFFPFSLSLSLCFYPSRFVMTRRDGSDSVGHSRQFDWAIAVYLSPPYASASISFAVSLRDRCLNN